MKNWRKEIMEDGEIFLLLVIYRSLLENVFIQAHDGRGWWGCKQRKDGFVHRDHAVTLGVSHCPHSRL